MRLANGTDLVETGWYDNVADIWRGFSKNAYGGVGYNPWAAAAVVLVLMPVLLLPLLPGGPGSGRGRYPQGHRRVAGGPLAQQPDARLAPGAGPTVDHPSAPLHGGLLGLGAGLVGDAVGYPPLRWSGPDRKVPTRPIEAP